MSVSRRKGQTALFFILFMAVLIILLLSMMDIVKLNTVLKSKKVISVSADVSDKGTGALAMLSRERGGKSYIQILGESATYNYQTMNQDEYDSLKSTLEKFGDTFLFKFSDKPLDISTTPERASPAYGSCGHDANLGISLVWPLKSATRVTSGYGYRDSPSPCYCHSGVDMATGGGTHDEVVAAYDGTVSFAYKDCKESPNCFNYPQDPNCGCDGGFGNRIMIRHVTPNGQEFYTHYYHLSEVFVSAGDSVSASQRIAITGNTGRSEAPHLHFELATAPGLTDDLAVDPCPYFSNSPADCEKQEIASCSISRTRSSFAIDIPLPGAGAKTKGEFTVEKW